MSETPNIEVDLADLEPRDWYARLDELGEEHGYLEWLGDDHAALFIDAGPKLMVTFEDAETMRKMPGASPRGFELLARNGWSLLCILSEGDTWFRAPPLYGFFDRLSDDGFFEDFDDVLFFGSHAGG
ncbi:MAG: hypothetical protein JKX69_01800, partial [Rhodobacteraceae bacterium]|nr:hypothetical protein [Paracoccaceae bacterium]